MLTVFWLENLKGRDHVEEIDADGKTILEWILGRWVGRCGLDVSALGWGPLVGLVKKR
jgi:hypothetical protein